VITHADKLMAIGAMGSYSAFSKKFRQWNIAPDAREQGDPFVVTLHDTSLPERQAKDTRKIQRLNQNEIKDTTKEFEKWLGRLEQRAGIVFTERYYTSFFKKETKKKKITT